MANYYIKKVADDDVHLYLQCSVNGNGGLVVQGLSLYSDPYCLQPCTTPPTIAGSDVFNTSQGCCRIHLEPSSSGAWTFRARVKGTSSLHNPLDVTGAANDSASFAVVATASGETDLVLDPTIRFDNNVMQQAGVPTALMLASAYIDPPLAGAHGIALTLTMGPSDTLGTLVFDPSPHTLDAWGDPIGVLSVPPVVHEVEAVLPVDVEDPSGRGRTLGRVQCKGLHDAEVSLVRDELADRWTLIYAPNAGGRFVVPMFRP